MNGVSILMLVIGLFGLLLLALGLMSTAQDGNIQLVGRMYGGYFLALVGLFFAVLGFVGFSRMRRPGKHD
jgi:ABC-type transport system involved in multi-copper enzyme maturation permease subunit